MKQELSMLRDFFDALAAMQQVPKGDIALAIISVVGLFGITFAGLGLGGGM